MKRAIQEFCVELTEEELNEFMNPSGKNAEWVIKETDIKPRENLAEDLKKQVEEFGCLEFDMSTMDSQEFWNFWKTNPEIEVVIYRPDIDKLHLIPEDAKLVVDSNPYMSLKKLFEGVEHVKDVTCGQVFDTEIVGYRGNIKFEDIAITDLKCGNDIPDATNYVVYWNSWQIKNLDVGFDCRGKGLYFTHLEPIDEPGELLSHFTNYSTFGLSSECFAEIYDAARHVFVDPNITIDLTLDDVSVLHNRYIANLILSSPHYPESILIPRDNVDIQVGNLIDHSEEFDELVKIILRGKKTKGAHK